MKRTNLPHIVIIDFDGVLFDDRRFKKEYESLFRHAGVSHDLYEKTYQQSKEKGHYDPRAHIRLALGFVSSEPSVQKNLYARVTKFLEQSSRYVFKDVSDFLGFLKKEHIRAVLLSTGDPVFQKQKIAKSGIEHLFDDVVIISEASKLHAIDAMVRKEKSTRFMFIDDKKEVVEEIKKSLPSVHVVHMQRNMITTEASNLDICISNFSELITIIKEWRVVSEHSALRALVNHGTLGT